jgi:SAM-dependent methyltransferase
MLEKTEKVVNCSCCPPENVNDLENTFNAKRAKSDALHYIRKGLDGRGRKLIAYLVAQADKPWSVLDVGCGAGGVHHELLRRGVAGQVVGVDVSSAYLEAAAANAARLGLSEHVTYHQADFALTAEPFAPADVVIMDRVICCYPHLQQLLGAAAGRTRRYLALSFPLESWWVRLPFFLMDAALKLVRSGYHPYLHPHQEVSAIARAAGLRPAYQARSGIWQIMVFGRTAARQPVVAIGRLSAAADFLSSDCLLQSLAHPTIQALV